MDIREYIEKGTTKAGTLTALGRMLGLSQQNMTNAKAHQRSMPLDACVKLANYIGEEPLRVIAANELATEKKEEKRNYWQTLAASVALAACSVTTFVTPSPAEAAQTQEMTSETICIM